MMKRTFLLMSGLLYGAFLAVPETASAQLLEVKQTVFGMDCAPCAYALEKRVKKIDGVTGATVSLNKGLAEITLAEDNRRTLEEIRQAIEDSGFSPREATVRAAGNVARDGSRWILALESGERFVLKAQHDSKLTEGNAVVTGRTVHREESADQPLMLDVVSFAARR